MCSLCGFLHLPFFCSSQKYSQLKFNPKTGGEEIDLYLTQRAFEIKVNTMGLTGILTQSSNPTLYASSVEHNPWPGDRTDRFGEIIPQLHFFFLYQFTPKKVMTPLGCKGILGVKEYKKRL